MADLVSEKGEFSCNFCTSKLKLGITSSSTSGESNKLANRTNSFFAPPGGNCSFPPGVPPSPCPGVPPGCVIATGQTIVEIDGQTALGDGCKFLCPKMQPVLLSKAGQTVGKHNEASGNVAAMIVGGVLIVAGVALLISLLPAEVVAAAVAGLALAARAVGRVAIALLAKAVKMAINALKKKPSAKPQPKPQPQIQAKSQPKQVTQQPKQQPKQENQQPKQQAEPVAKSNSSPKSENTSSTSSNQSQTTAGRRKQPESFADGVRARDQIRRYLNGAPAKNKEELISAIESTGLKLKGKSPDGKFMEFVDKYGNVRAKLHPPDKVTPYHHLHLYDTQGNAVNTLLYKVPKESPAAHIPYGGP